MWCAAFQLLVPEPQPASTPPHHYTFAAGRLRSLALGLAHLSDLQLNNCVELGQVVLHCPALERLSMQVGGWEGRWGPEGVCSSAHSGWCCAMQGTTLPCPCS